MNQAFIIQPLSISSFNPSIGTPRCVPTRPLIQSPLRHRSRNIIPIACATSSSPDSDSEASLSEKEVLLQSLSPKQLKWSEIPFSSIEEELAAIDEYEREEDPPANDPWPKFLRGAAYEYWGQPTLALAQYAKTCHASGLKRVPELWERRAYNAFKLGNVKAANVYYELALSLMNESTGNELHFMHWFYEHFQDYLPKWNGPPAPVQRGISKYCVGYPKDACNSFVPQIYTTEKDVEHPLLWFLACCGRFGGENEMSAGDMKVVDRALEKSEDWDPRLQIFIKLFYAAARRVFGEVTDAELELSEDIKGDESDDITTYVYLALYHDAFTGNTEERDRSLDTVAAIGSPKSTNDTENFLFHVAKNRISMPEYDGVGSADSTLSDMML